MDFALHVVDLLDAFGSVEAKRMFGGVGLFSGGLMFGLIADSTLYLKADQSSKSEFEDKGLEPFSYYKNEKEFKLSYYLAPEEFFEDQDETLRWATLAYEAALRAPKKAKKTKKSNS